MITRFLVACLGRSRAPQTRTLALVCMAALAALGATAASASASVEYENVCTSLAPPAICTPGGLPGARGVAVNDETGEVYVEVAGEIKVFSATGEALKSIAAPGGPDWIAVDNSAGATHGDIYASFFGEAQVRRFTPTGELDETFATKGVLTTPENPAGIAVDPANGDVYVAVRQDTSVHVYDSSGNALAGESFPIGAGNIDGLSVDSGGNAFVVLEGSSINEYPSANRAAPVEIGVGLGPTETAVDTSPGGNLFVFGGGVISLFEKSGAHASIASIFEPGAPGGSYGMAVNASSHAVYVSDINNGDAVYYVIAEHGPPPQAPVTEAGTATGTSATLHGTLNPTTSAAVSYFFDYNATPGETCTGVGHQKSEVKTIAEEEAVPVEATVTGLIAKTPYTFCLVAENHGGATPSAGEESFTTGISAPVIEEQSASEVAPHAATVSAKVNPSGDASTCEVEYGTEEGVYPNKVACSALAEPEGIVGQATSVPLSGLEPATTYHFRFVAVNGEGTVPGADATFTTLPLAVATTEAPSALAPKSATLSGSIVSNVAGAVEYFFEYTQEGVTLSTPTATFASSPVSAEISGLKPTVPVTVTLNVIAEGHTVAGSPVEFTPPALIEASNEPVSAIGPESATLNGHLLVRTEASHYFFLYGREGEPLETKTAETAVGAETSVSVFAAVSGLAPNTHYEAELVGVAADSTVVTAAPPVKFVTRIAVPAVTNTAPSSVSRTTAAITGLVNTEEGASEYVVEYGLTTAYESGVSPSGKLEAATGDSPIEHVLLSELKAGTTYHYRIVASNESGTTNGPDATFTTGKPQPPSAVTGEAQGVSGTSATVTGSVVPDGLPTSYVFQVGTETSPGVVSYTPTYGSAGSGTEPVPLTLPLSGLQPATVYHFRITASNEDGVATGADLTFTTAGFPSSIVAPSPVVLVPFTEPVEPPVKPAITPSLSRAEKLKKALKACSAKPKRKRPACVKAAHRRFGPLKKKGKR